MCHSCERITPTLTRDHRWHWRAFLTGGGSAFWLLAYGLFYWASRLSLSSVQSALLYLGYLLLIALFDFLVTGMKFPLIFAKCTDAFVKVLSAS